MHGPSVDFRTIEGLGVPAYRWCKVWGQWKATGHNTCKCMAAYKFVTHGGKELGMQSVFQPNFHWAFKTCTINVFFAKCCAVFRSQFAGVQQAWLHWGAVSLEEPLRLSGTFTPWATCIAWLGQPSWFSKGDFFKFLDVDGYGGV